MREYAESACGNQLLGQCFEYAYPCRETVTTDGVRLQTYCSEVRHDSAVLLVAPCGMPATLCGSWMRWLSQQHFVMTWETRYLFGPNVGFAADGCTVARQTEDLFAVMDTYDIARVHIMGVCGGAILALQAAAQRPERVRSLSLWHGDFNLGPQAPQTSYQRNLRALLAMAAQDRESAATIRSMLSQVALSGAPAGVAPLVRYPFSSDELLFRYAHLNGAQMATDLLPLLSTVRQPALVVTSQLDQTTHPAGSYLVAERLPRATLHVAATGDHLSFFSAADGATNLAAGFLETC